MPLCYGSQADSNKRAMHWLTWWVWYMHAIFNDAEEVGNLIIESKLSFLF